MRFVLKGDYSTDTVLLAFFHTPNPSRVASIRITLKYICAAVYKIVSIHIRISIQLIKNLNSYYSMK